MVQSMLRWTAVRVSCVADEGGCVLAAQEEDSLVAALEAVGLREPEPGRATGVGDESQHGDAALGTFGERAVAGGGGAAAAAVRPSSGVDEHVDPLHAPLALFAELTAHKHPSHGPTPTLHEALTAHVQSVRELAAELHVLDAGAGDLGAAAARLQQLLRRILLLPMMLSGARRRPDIVWAMCSTHVDTGEQLPDGADAERMVQIIPALQLSRMQRMRIAASKRVFEELRLPIVAEQRRLQGEQQPTPSSSTAATGGGGASASSAATATPLARPPAPAASSATSGSSGSASTGGGSSGAAASDDSSASMPRPFQHAARSSALHAAARRQRRIRLLMQKEALLCGVMGMFAYGCLTWRQLARLYVLFAPFYPSSVLLASVLAEQVAGEEARDDAVAEVVLRNRIARFEPDAPALQLQRPGGVAKHRGSGGAARRGRG
ncbi:hypothetical protein HT031_000998 [Scenedesmus sp. PABB004]|nr:hypothetical protein HT031_000998 [Scenedesmus sp. PABB004]